MLDNGCKRVKTKEPFFIARMGVGRQLTQASIANCMEVAKLLKQPVRFNICIDAQLYWSAADSRYFKCYSHRICKPEPTVSHKF